MAQAVGGWRDVRLEPAESAVFLVVYVVDGQQLAPGSGPRRPPASSSRCCASSAVSRSSRSRPASSASRSARGGLAHRPGRGLYLPGLITNVAYGIGAGGLLLVVGHPARLRRRRRDRRPHRLAVGPEQRRAYARHVVLRRRVRGPARRAGAAPPRRRRRGARHGGLGHGLAAVALAADLRVPGDQPARARRRCRRAASAGPPGTTLATTLTVVRR